MHQRNVIEASDFFQSEKSQTLIKAREVILAREIEPLSLPAKKLFNYLLHKKRREPANVPGSPQLHSVQVSELRGFVGDRAITRRLAELLRELGKSTIEVTYQDRGREHTLVMHYLSYDLTHHEDGHLIYGFDPMLLGFIQQPKVYAKLNMDIYKKFQSAPAAKLYEILCLYSFRDHRVWKVGKEELLTVIQAADCAKRTDNLTRALNKYLEEVNRVSDICASYTSIRGGKGGRVLAYEFRVRPKTPYEIESGTLVTVNRPQVRRDGDTIDLLDGLTDAERMKSRALLPETYDAARPLMFEDDRLDELEEQWRESVAATKTFADPNGSFLSWMNLRRSKMTNEELSELSEQTLAHSIELIKKNGAKIKDLLDDL